MNPAEFRLVVSSGPTREWLDPVRFLTNASSGRTGWCLAKAGVPRFGEVELISGPVCSHYRSVEGARSTPIESTYDLLAAVDAALCDKSILIMAAAPADYTPLEFSQKKLKKTGDKRIVELQPTPDVLAATAKKAAGLQRCYRIGFAAETNDMENNALEKLERKGLHFICGNEVYREDRGFGENPNRWALFGRQGQQAVFGPADKEALADSLLEYLIAGLE